MRKFVYSMWMSVLVLAVGTATAHAQTSPAGATGNAPARATPLVQSSVDEVASELDGARESFLSIDGSQAALRIRRAAETMRERAANATEAGREAIEQSAAELQLLAQAVEERRVASVHALDEAFARANFAMANSHLLLAIRAQNEQARQRVGEELNASAAYFQAGTRRLRKTAWKEEEELVRNTRRLAANLIHNVGATADEVGQGIRLFGQRLQQVQAGDTAAQRSPPTAPAKK